MRPLNDNKMRASLVFGITVLWLGVMAAAVSTTGAKAVASAPKWWRKVTTSVQPPARVNHAMALADDSGEVVLFGGGSRGTLFSDTWTFSETGWRLRLPASSPSPRYCHAMGYDPLRRVVVLFGGWGNGYLGDTWEWDGVNWVEKQTQTSPGVRCESRMTFDPASSRMILFGGLRGGDSADYLNDTWTYDGTNWRLEQPAHSPSPRQSFVLVADQTGVLLYGGFNFPADPNLVTNGAVYGDTWRWDGVAREWVKLAPASSPPPLFGAAAAFDRGARQVILFGGMSVNWGGMELDGTWTWDGSTWTEELPHRRPDALYSPAMTSSAAGGVVLFGGFSSAAGGTLSDTWQYPCPPGQAPGMGCSR